MFKHTKNTLLVLAALMAIMLVTPAYATSKVNPPEQIKTVIEEFIQCFNNRNVDAMLALYEEDAKISATVRKTTCWLSKDEYRPRLARKMEGMALKGVKIVGYRIEGLDYIGPKTAELRVAVKAAAGPFKMVERGKLRLDKNSGGWRIAVAEM